MIRVLGARERNLQGVELSLDPGALTVFSGVSGSGKSSLAFDTLHAEGRRRLADALSPGAAAGALRRPAVDAVSGLPPTLAVAQRGGTVADRRTTVGTLTDITPLLRVLYARAGEQRCPTCDAVITPQSPEAIIAALQALPAGTRLTVMGPRVRREVGSMSALLRGMLEAGFVRARVDGVVSRIEDLGPLDARAPHDVDVVVDRIRAGPDKADRLAEAARLGLAAGRGRLVVDAGGEERFYAEVAWCGRCQREWPPLSQRLLSFSSPEGACQGCGGLGVVEVDGGERTCGDCGGGRLGPAGAAVKLGGLSLPQRSAAPLGALALPEALAAQPGVAPVVEELRHRLSLLAQVGLGYLALDRSGPSLSSGELQRVRLAGCAGSRLTGVLYVLDEPTAGLHPRDTERLVVLLRALRDAGSGVLVVEHDGAVIRAADRCVDFGPGPGELGGRVIFEGTPDALAAADTPTGRWLSGRAEAPASRGRTPRRYLTVEGARGHNLDGISARFPLKCLTAVTGVSGAGKSTLVFDTLHRALAARLVPGWAGPPALPHDALGGAEAILRVVAVDDAGPGRTPRSMPATLLKIWDPIRRLFAATREARIRGLTASSFSLNQRGGRCEACQGRGEVEVDLGMMAPVFTPCAHCGGRRFNAGALAARYRGMDLAEVLEMSASQARVAFAGHPAVEGPLEALEAVGLGYLQLGRGAHTLSGGEARRVKLARELGRSGRRGAPALEGSLVLLDEPAVGLHPADVARVVEVLQRLVDGGATVVTVEHDPLLVGAADRVLELGPGGGPEGGRLTWEGPPRGVSS